MKLKFFLLAAISFFFSCISTAQFCIPEQGVAIHSKAMGQINPLHIQWIKSISTSLSSGKILVDELDQQAKSYGKLNNLVDMDIEALLILVMMENAKNTEEDIRTIMEQMREANKRKQAMRNSLNLLKKNQADQKNKIRKDYGSRTQYDSLKRSITPSVVTNPGSAAVTKAELDDLLNIFRDKLDSMSEMGEMESLRLQMAMDRMSKMMSTLSNLLKKISDTTEDITKNLK